MRPAIKKDITPLFASFIASMIPRSSALAIVVLGYVAGAQAAPTGTTTYAEALPTPTRDATSFKVPIHVNKEALHPRNQRMTMEELDQWLSREHEMLRIKYTHPDDRNASWHEKRQQVGLGDFGTDSYYFAPIGIGTPLETMNVVLDTGSADFWLADAQCGVQDNCDTDMPKYDASVSKTYRSSNTPFQVQYGSGAVRGTLATEFVSLAGYNVSSVTFGQASHLAQGTINAPASGIMGMGFDSLSTTGTMPFWQILAERQKLHDYVFTFQLRNNMDNVNHNNMVNPGGVFTLGVLDSQQYSGDITWTPLSKGFGPNGLGYWALDIQEMRVNNQVVQLDQYNVAAIDTGTTLIGGPPKVVQEIYRMIPGARPYQGNSYFTIPCSGDFTVDLTFGGRKWSLKSSDLIIAPVSSSQCLSAIFVSPTGSPRMPTWIIGDSFLKTVFSAFGSAPANIGFANLPSGGAQAMSLTSVAMNSGRGSGNAASSSDGLPLGDGGQGGGGGGDGSGLFSYNSPQQNTDQSWKTASVDVPNNIQPLSAEVSGGDGSMFGNGVSRAWPSIPVYVGMALATLAWLL